MFDLEWIYRSGIIGSGVRETLDLVFEVGWILQHRLRRLLFVRIVHYGTIQSLDSVYTMSVENE